MYNDRCPEEHEYCGCRYAEETAPQRVCCTHCPFERCVQDAQGNYQRGMVHRFAVERLKAMGLSVNAIGEELHLSQRQVYRIMMAVGLPVGNRLSAPPARKLRPKRSPPPGQ